MASSSRIWEKEEEQECSEVDRDARGEIHGFLGRFFSTKIVANGWEDWFIRGKPDGSIRNH